MINFEKIKKSVYQTGLNENKGNNSIVKFFNTISKSKALVYEFYIYNNIKKTYISDRNDAKTFLKENISFLVQFSLKDREQGIKNIKGFLNEDVYVDDLDSNIHNLISIKLKGLNPKNIKMFNESFEYVLDYITSNEKVNDKPLNESSIFDQEEFKNIDFRLIINKVGKTFDRKYNSILSESENRMLKDLISFDENKEINVFNTFKQHIINEIHKKSDELSEEMINESIYKIEEMKYHPDKFIDDMIMLNDLISE